MSGPPPPLLPPLPIEFFSKRVASSSHPRPRPPPLPPLPPGALEQENQYRASFSRSNAIPSPASNNSSGLPSPYNTQPFSNIPPIATGAAPPSSSSFFPPQPMPPLVVGLSTSLRSPSPMSSAQPAFPPQPQYHVASHSTRSPQPGYLMPTSVSSPMMINRDRSHSMTYDQSASDLSTPLNSLSLGLPSPSNNNNNNHYLANARRASSSQVVSSSYSPHDQQPNQKSHRKSTLTNPPCLNAPLPDMDSLEAQRKKAFASLDDKKLISWSKQVLKYVERKFTDGSKISEPRLVRWTDEAIGVISRKASSVKPDPEALYLRGDLQASGAFPTYHRKDLKEAFNDFELSARMGWAPSWFRIGRDYELLNDFVRAKDAYERGVLAGDVGSIYRLGMASLLGQLELSVNHSRAVSLLKDGADRANFDTPQPAYIYGMLLAGEFNHVEIPKYLLQPTPSTTLEAEARKRIERAAYLNFAPAQYKCGWLYEYAQLDCPFDPLLSVQYYSLASQGGEIEADMALSKWFLCGAEGFFEKNESLAFTFADKAARKGLGSAEFALGYYNEVGVGTEIHLDTARRWYKKAAAHDNTDAQERLKALEGPSPHALSRNEHETNVDVKLQRKRTQAKMKSEREGRKDSYRPSQQQQLQQRQASSSGSGNRNNALEITRKKTMTMVEETVGRRRRKNGYNYIDPAESSTPAPAAAAVVPPAAASTTTTAVAGGGGIVPTQYKPNQPIVAGPTTASSRHGSGYILSDSPTKPVYSQPPHHVPSSSSSAIPTSTTTTSFSSSNTGNNGKKVYNTFAEMGFPAQKVKKEECLIC